MLTLTLQCVAALLGLALAPMALSIAGHRAPLSADRAAGWRLAGVGFGLLGLSATAQSGAAVFAFVAGPATTLYDGYLRWAPAGNYSRAFMGMAMAGVMVRLAWTGADPDRRTWMRIVAGLVAAGGLGAALGGMEGRFEIEIHGFSMAVLHTAEVIAFSLALVVSAARGTFDLFLFGTVALYTLMMVLGIPVLTGMGLNPGGIPALPPWTLPVQSTVFSAGMLMLAAWRRSLLQRRLQIRRSLASPPPRPDLPPAPSSTGDTKGARSMRRFAPFLGILAVLLASPLSAQTPAKAEVRATVDRLFDAMRSGDSATVRAVFHPRARLMSVGGGPAGTALAEVAVDDFARAVGGPRPAVFDERISNVRIEVDGPLATAWMDYEFFLGDRFSHCGVNAFQLARGESGWRILQIADTRRRQDCPSSPARGSRP